MTHTGEPREAGKNGIDCDPQEGRAGGQEDKRERMMDKTLADSFPTSDPPSSIPEPAGESVPDSPVHSRELLIAGLPPGSWAALSIPDDKLVGTGTTSDEAAQKAKENGYSQVSLLRVPTDPDAPVQAA